MASPPTTLLDKPHPYIQTSQTDDTQLQYVARNVVWNALVSAYHRVLHGTKQMEDMTVQMEAMSFDMSDTQKPDWTIPKQGSSVVSLESEGFVNASSDLRKVAFADRTGVVYIDEDYEEELKIVAKKLVNKALHLAYKTVESLYRRSSIEYLIASTKRMKISHSPSPPPPTVFEDPNADSNGQPKPLHLSRNRRSPSPDTRLRKLGAKRQRSGSHDIAILSDQHRTKKLLVSGKSQVDSDPRHILRVQHGTEPPPVSQLAKIAFSVSQMSIAEESDEESDEESYTILEAVQRTPEQSELHNPSSAVPVYHMYPPRPPPAAEQGISSIVVSPDPILDMDLFVIVHSYPPPSQCQKFLCVNTDEVNLVYHCWLYKDSPFDSNHTLNRKVQMGVFCPQGVEQVHLNLQDAGVPFDFLDER